MTQYDTSLALYIAGQWRSGEGRETHDVLDPATGAAHAPLPLANAADLDLALEAAQRGFKVWRDTAPEVRGAVLTKAANLLRERAGRIGWGGFPFGRQKRGQPEQSHPDTGAGEPFAA